MIKSSRHFSRSEKPTRRGALTVEMALTLPILLVVVFACLEFGRMNMIRNSAKNAAYKAARSAIIPGAQAGSAQTVARNLMQAIGVSNANITISPANITNTTPSVTVTIVTSLNGNLFFAPMFLANKSITTTCTLNREDY